VTEVGAEIVPAEHAEIVATPRRAEPRLKGEELRIHAFEMYLTEQEMSLAQIAHRLGVSPQYVYRIAQAQRWAERRAQAQGAIYTGNRKMDGALERAVLELQLKLPTRLCELVILCQHKDPRIRLGAIREWISLTVKLGGQGDSGPRSVEIVNDLRDQRQVTIVQGPSPLQPDEDPGVTVEPHEDSRL